MLKVMILGEWQPTGPDIGAERPKIAHGLPRLSTGGLWVAHSVLTCRCWDEVLAKLNGSVDTMLLLEPVHNTVQGEVPLSCEDQHLATDLLPSETL